MLKWGLSPACRGAMDNLYWNLFLVKDCPFPRCGKRAFYFDFILSGGERLAK